jgi:hypothetical protein
MNKTKVNYKWRSLLNDTCEISDEERLEDDEMRDFNVPQVLAVFEQNLAPVSCFARAPSRIQLPGVPAPPDGLD